MCFHRTWTKCGLQFLRSEVCIWRKLFRFIWLIWYWYILNIFSSKSDFILFSTFPRYGITLQVISAINALAWYKGKTDNRITRGQICVRLDVHRWELKNQAEVLSRCAACQHCTRDVFCSSPFQWIAFCFLFSVFFLFAEGFQAKLRYWRVLPAGM